MMFRNTSNTLQFRNVSKRQWFRLTIRYTHFRPELGSQYLLARKQDLEDSKTGEKQYLHASMTRQAAYSALAYLASTSHSSATAAPYPHGTLTRLQVTGTLLRFGTYMKTSRLDVRTGLRLSCSRLEKCR